MAQTIQRSELDLPLVVTTLLTGPVHRERQTVVWQHLSALVPQVRDYVRVVGLDVVVDDTEGYAFLRSLPDDEDRSGPRLVRRRSLTYHVSLLLALLRKRLAEHDATSESSRLVLTRDELVHMVAIHQPAASEARQVEQAETTIRKVADLGFLRRVGSGNPAEYEVERILKAFVTAEWLVGFERTLARAAGEPDGETTVDIDEILRAEGEEQP